MSKKHHRRYQFETGTLPAAAAPASIEQAAEYRIIKRDLLRVLILNLVFLAVLILLYFTNQRQQFLEHWLGKLLGF